MAQKGDGDRKPGTAGFDDQKTEIAYYVDHVAASFGDIIYQEFAHVMQELLQDAYATDVTCNGCGDRPADLDDCRFIEKNGICRKCMGVD